MHHSAASAAEHAAVANIMKPPPLRPGHARRRIAAALRRFQPRFEDALLRANSPASRWPRSSGDPILRPRRRCALRVAAELLRVRLRRRTSSPERRLVRVRRPPIDLGRRRRSRLHIRRELSRQPAVSRPGLLAHNFAKRFAAAQYCSDGGVHLLRSCLAVLGRTAAHRGGRGVAAQSRIRACGRDRETLPPTPRWVYKSGKRFPRLSGSSNWLAAWASPAADPADRRRCRPRPRRNPRVAIVRVLGDHPLDDLHHRRRQPGHRVVEPDRLSP